MIRDWADAVAAVAITVWRWAASGLGAAIDAMDWLRDVAPARLRDLLSDTSRSDGDAAPTPYSAANTALSHEAIAMWTCLGGLTLGAHPVAATVAAVTLWGGIWEWRQYLASPRVRTLRDWLVGDLPSYVIGAVAAAVLVGEAIAGRWPEWLSLTPIVVLWPGVNGLIFGRAK